MPGFFSSATQHHPPVNGWNDGTVETLPGQSNEAALARPVNVAIGACMESTRWQNFPLNVGEVLDSFCRYEVSSKKDGRGFVPGGLKWAFGGFDLCDGSPEKIKTRDSDGNEKLVSVRGHRMDRNLFSLDFLVLDFDGGYAPEEIRDWLISKDLIFSAYSSHSHLKDGETPKFRVMLPLAESFQFTDAVTDKRRWSLAVEKFVTEELGLEIGPEKLDPAVLKPAQFYYIPRFHPDRPRFIWVREAGEPVRLPEVDVSQWKRSAVAKRERPNGKREGSGLSADDADLTTPNGECLKTWVWQHGSVYQFANMLRDHAPDFIRADKHDRLEILCPFADLHSPGGKDECFVLMGDNGFHIGCHHTHGKKHSDRLLYVRAMLEQDWFEESVLFDTAYIPETIADDEPAAVGTSGDGGPIKPELEDDSDLYLFDAENDLVDAINERYAVARVGGKVVILWEDGLEYGFFAQHAAGAWLAPYRLRVKKNETVSGLGVWLKSARRRYYKSVAFEPKGTPDDVFNLWKGFAVESRPGNCERMKYHLREVVCGGDGELYEYLIGWFAQLVQEPGRKPGSSVVLRGKQGTGKSTVADWFSDILGPSWLRVSQSSQITGQFNGHLERVLFLNCEESFWAGDKRGEGALKNLITSNQITVERKGLDAFSLSNYSRLFITSNADWVVPASGDSRRFLVLDVSDKHAKDIAYFSALNRERQNGGVEAFLYELQHHDYSNVDLWNPPRTTAWENQVEESMTPEISWWQDLLEAGALPSTDGESDPIPEWKTGPVEISTQDMLESFNQFVPGRAGRTASAQKLRLFLRKAVPSVETVRRRDGHVRGRYYMLPPLPELRQAFEATHNVRLAV